jgi:flagellar assembly protein FliH
MPEGEAFSGDLQAGAIPVKSDANAVPSWLTFASAELDGKNQTDSMKTAEADGQHGETSTGGVAGASGANGWEKISEEGMEILKIARKEAESIIQTARTQAEGIINAAKQTEESLRQETLTSVLEKDLPEALDQGRETGREEGRREFEDIIAKAQGFYEMMERALHDEYMKVDEDLLNLALKICDRILGTILRYDKEKLLSMIRSIILLPNERRNLKIHVSDADWEWLNHLKDKGLPPYPLIRDEGLKQGNVLVQSNEGIFDAQLENQLDKFREVLSEELINGQLESIGSKSQKH